LSSGVDPSSDPITGFHAPPRLFITSPISTRFRPPTLPVALDVASLPRPVRSPSLHATSGHTAPLGIDLTCLQPNHPDEWEEPNTFLRFLIFKRRLRASGLWDTFPAAAPTAPLPAPRPCFFFSGGALDFTTHGRGESCRHHPPNSDNIAATFLLPGFKDPAPTKSSSYIPRRPCGKRKDLCVAAIHHRPPDESAAGIRHGPTNFVGPVFSPLTRPAPPVVSRPARQELTDRFRELH
jgi:hypothetical protein